jgi:hypothetical protein
VAALANTYQGEPAGHCVALARAALQGGDLIDADNGLLSTSAICALVLTDHHDEALAAWETTQADGYRRGSLFAISSIHLWRGFTMLWHGDLREAASLLQAASSSFSLFGYGPHAGVYHSGFTAWVEIERGDLDAARTALMQGSDFGGHADGLRFWRSRPPARWRRAFPTRAGRLRRAGAR